MDSFGMLWKSNEIIFLYGVNIILHQKCDDKRTHCLLALHADSVCDVV